MRHLAQPRAAIDDDPGCGLAPPSSKGFAGVGLIVSLPATLGYTWW